MTWNIASVKPRLRCFRSVCALRSDPRPSQIAISEQPTCSAGGFFIGYTIRSYATESYMIGSYICVQSSSEQHTSESQSLMRTSLDVLRLSTQSHTPT